MSSLKSDHGWRTYAPRYGLRILLLGMAVAGVVLGLDVKRAHDRERLIREVTALGGSYKTAARRGIPVPLRQFLSHSQGHIVEEVSLGGMLAHSEFGRARDGTRLEVRDLDEFRHVLSMPGMRQVRSLKLSGTEISDALIDDLAELHRLESVDFYETAVTARGAGKLKQALGDSKVRWGSSPALSVKGGWRMQPENGQHIVRIRHSNLFRFLGDVSIFTQAKDGDPQAVETVLARIREAPWPYISAVLEELGSVKSNANLHRLHEALDDENSRVRRFLVATLDSEPELLTAALEDSDMDVRVEALHKIRDLKDEQARRLLRLAMQNESAEARGLAIRYMEEMKALESEDVLTMVTNDSSPEVRWTAIDTLDEFSDPRVVDVLIVALRDEASVVRSAAARMLGTMGDARAIEALEAALADEDSFVQNHARNALQSLASR